MYEFGNAPILVKAPNLFMLFMLRNQTMDKKIALFEKIFAICSLIHYSAGVLPLILTQGASEGDRVDINSFNFQLNQLSFLVVYLLTLCFLILRWKKTLVVIKQNKWICLFLAIAVLSFLWSVAPLTSLEQSVDLIMASLFGLYLATRYTLKEQTILLSQFFLTVLVLSVLFVFVPPRYGIMGGIHLGSWRGIYTHKNIFGQITALGSIFFLNRAITGKNIFLYWFAFALSAVLVYLSNSSGALLIYLALLTLFCIYYLYISYPWKMVYLAPVIAFSLLVIGATMLWLFEHLETISEISGKDLTLTGRTIFWQALILKINQRPLLGFGLSSFWHGLEGPSADIIHLANWSVPNAHNGFLDLVLSLGVIGLLVFVVGYFVNVYRAAMHMHFERSRESFWPLIFLIFLFFSNLPESSLLDSQFNWILYVMLSFSLPLSSTFAVSLNQQQKLQAGAIY